jgi:hypothetical protein
MKGWLIKKPKAPDSESKTTRKGDEQEVKDNKVDKDDEQSRTEKKKERRDVKEKEEENSPRANGRKAAREADDDDDVLVFDEDDDVLVFDDDDDDGDDDSDVFVVEKICDYNEKTDLFFTKWSGYPESDNTWEPIESFTDRKSAEAFRAQKLKKLAEQKAKGKPRDQKSVIDENGASKAKVSKGGCISRCCY